MAGSKEDSFLRDLSFSGIPSEYRQFRRKILLSVASLEGKQIKLAGPKILTRLSGEAWRATEHLSVAELRASDGWLKVLSALDSHYRFLPETELNESVDEFLFHLKRKPNEGPTAFISRFKAALSRLETLIAADKAAQKHEPKRRRAKVIETDRKPSSSSSSESDISSMDREKMTAENVRQASAAAAAEEKPTGSTEKQHKTVGSFVSDKSPGKAKGPPSSGGRSAGSRGTHKADDEKAQRKMLEDLELLEQGHLKLRPVFPAVVLGHLFMRKYGLTREQRSLVVRATGGSSKFEDVERIIRASDFEDRRVDHSRDPRSVPRGARRDTVFEASADSPSLSEPSLPSSDAEAYEAELETDDEDVQEQMLEAYEMQKRAKEGVKKHFKNYKDQRKRLREIKKTRQPYMPVVALAPGASGDGTAVAAQPAAMQPTFKYDRKGRGDDKKKGASRARKEDVHLIQSEILTEFSYMITTEEPALTEEIEVFLASIPQGNAVIDTGCTSSVIGEKSAKRLAEFLATRGIQGPESLDLPPVQLRGFNGARTTSSKGLRWTIRLGNLWGTVTTYVIPGETPFLLSRKVLEGMQATLDLGAMTLTSEKHGMIGQPLAQASNGHLLLPLVPEPESGTFQACSGSPEALEVDDDDDERPPEDNSSHVDSAFCAYKPKFERIPVQSHTTTTYRAIARLDNTGAVSVDAWEERPAGKRRRAYECRDTCIFAFRRKPVKAASDRQSVERAEQDAALPASPECVGPDAEATEVEGKATGNMEESQASLDLAALYEAVRRAPFQMQLSAVASNPAEIRDELRDWNRNGASIRIGLEWGQDLLRARDRRLLLQLIALTKLAHRAKASAEVIQAIKDFKCAVCEELQVPPSHRVTAMSHTETPNHIVGLDIVQVELKKDSPQGVVETKFNVLTAVDYATDFAQQVVLPPGPRSVAKAFHQLWCRPYGPPRVVYVDPDQRWISGDFQDYLRHNSITLLSAATESHWQIGRVEIAQRILRNMAKRVWRTTSRPAHEVIETCATTCNEHLRKHGFSSAQWFLGREPRVPASLADVTERDNLATQDAVLSEPDFHAKMHCRQLAAHAFIEAHAHETWRKAIQGRNRPLRGPYVVGQSVYVFRRGARGLLSTRHGVWHGPGKVVGTEGFRHDSPVPRVIWVVINGLMYKCSPECLRPIVEDEQMFKQLAQEYHTGVLAPELEVPRRYMGPGGHCVDLTNQPPEDADFDDLLPPLEHEPPELPDNPAPAVRRRVTHGPAYWEGRAADLQESQTELGQIPSPRPLPSTRPGADLPQEGERLKSRRLEEPEAPPSVTPGQVPDSMSELSYSPSLDPENLEGGQDLEGGPVQEGEPAESNALPPEAMCCEVSFEIFKDDVQDDISCLWTALAECAEVKTKPANKRRVEVNFRKLDSEDQEKFRHAMSKEWQSWLENKVTSIVKAKGIDRSRIIGSRWVLTWKTSADPDNKSVVPKARLVLVGYQDPDLGKIATDSPTLRKESKHIILSLCAAFGWILWSADIKTAFLSGDASCRNIHFRPPPEVRKIMGLGPDDLLRLEKAAYGLAEAPRAWFLRLTRELKALGLKVSALDPCVFLLRSPDNHLIGICGVHVDDLLGGGTAEMDKVLARLRKTLPFGEFRTKTIKYTGAEIRQHPDFSIELSQESYIEKMDFVPVPGKSTVDLPDARVMRACCGQLAWVASHSRPDQAFLSSYLQGVQDRAQYRHLTMYNKALREMKHHKVTLKFPCVPASDWRLLVITDAGWGVRESGESQGGLILCLCESKVLRQEEGKCWVIEWASKKLRRIVRSSTAAETLSCQNGLDCIEFAQAFIQECLEDMSPREFRTWTPEVQSGLVIDSKSLYDALTRSACSTALAIEKRLAIDYAIARASLQERNIVPFWTNNLQMVADSLTKLKGSSDILYQLLSTCRYRIKPCTQSGRKEKADAKPNYKSS
ncbi:RE1 [Symbiodinium sp. CCMP2592]|nr:RE1 [Symbiodinium sp. CCMP2592]